MYNPARTNAPPTPTQTPKKTTMFSRRNLDIPTAKQYITNQSHESLRAATKTGAPCVTATLT